MSEEELEPEEGIQCKIEELIEYCKIVPIKWIPTAKNKTFRYHAGMTIETIEDHVRTLRKDHYQDEVDDLSQGHTGKMYIFKRLVLEKYWCYIKIKLNRTKEGNIVAVISFHEDESK